MTINKNLNHLDEMDAIRYWSVNFGDINHLKTLKWRVPEIRMGVRPIGATIQCLIEANVSEYRCLTDFERNNISEFVISSLQRRNPYSSCYTCSKKYEKPIIKDVKFSKPATIVFWTDGTKTVVKCSENDVYDPEKGIAMCYAKKIMGNKGNYYETFKKYIPSDNSEPKQIVNDASSAIGYGLKRKYSNKGVTFSGKVTLDEKDLADITEYYMK